MEGVCIVTVWADGSLGFHVEPDQAAAQLVVAQPVGMPGTSYLFPLDVTTTPGVVRTLTPEAAARAAGQAATPA